jgi:hypothetical protein
LPGTRRDFFPTKNPRLTGNRGSLEIYVIYSLESSTHDAEARCAAVPNPDESGLTALHILLCCKRGFHGSDGRIKHDFKDVVKWLEIRVVLQFEPPVVRRAQLPTGCPQITQITQIKIQKNLRTSA